jgi:hypothetical protein
MSHMSQMKLISWFDIHNAPTSPGIYAWYAQVFISKADLDAFERNVAAAKATGADAGEVVLHTLERFVFSPFSENDYEVSVTGQLKPAYFGTLKHKPSISDSLVGRLVEQPYRLNEIARLLEKVVPYFTAPLYIGMAQNLRERLARHKHLIEQYNESPAQVWRDQEAGFARQVIARRLPPTKLRVAIAEFETRAAEPHDLENILNRINFPIFGRN